VSFPFATQKKKKRSTRFVETGEDDHVQDTSSSMAVDSTAEPTHPPPPIENFVDDDELQAALARTRRQKSKKVVKLTPAQIAQQRTSSPASQSVK
jgi:U4/U6.U5 tri-snRNP-associated protein 1